MIVRSSIIQESYSYDSVLEIHFQKHGHLVLRAKKACYQSSVQKPAYLMVQCRISIASVSQMCTLPVQWAVCTPGKTL